MDEAQQFKPVGRIRVESSAQSSTDVQKCSCEHCKPKSAVEANKWEKELKVDRIKQQKAAKGRALAEFQKRQQEKQQQQKPSSK